MTQLRRHAQAKRAIVDADQDPTDGSAPSPAKQMRRHSDTSGLRGGDDISRPVDVHAESVFVEDIHPQHKLMKSASNPPLGDAVNGGKSPADKNPSSSALSRPGQASKSKTRRDRHVNQVFAKLVPANDGPGASVEQNRVRDQRLKEDEAWRQAYLPATTESTHANYGQARYPSQQSRTDFEIPRTLSVNPNPRVEGNAFPPGRGDHGASSRIEQRNEHVALQWTHSGRIPGYGLPEIHERSTVAAGCHSEAHNQRSYSPSSLSSDPRQMRPPPWPYPRNNYPEMRLPGTQSNALELPHTFSNQPSFTNPQMSRAPDSRAGQQHTQAPDLVDPAMHQPGSHNGFVQQNPAPAFQGHGYGYTLEQSACQQMPAQIAFAPQAGAPNQANGYYQQPIRNPMQPLTSNGYHQQHTHSAMPPSASNGYDQQHTHNSVPLMTANEHTQQHMHNAMQPPIPDRYDQQRSQNATLFQTINDYSPQHKQSAMPPPTHWRPILDYPIPQLPQRGPAMTGTGQEDFFVDPSLDAATNDNTPGAPTPTYEDLEQWFGPPLPGFDPLP